MAGKKTGPKPGKQKRPEKPRDEPTTENPEVSNEYFCNLLGLSDRKIREMGQGGILVRSDIAGKLKQIESLESLCKHLTGHELETKRAIEREKLHRLQGDTLDQDLARQQKAGQLIERPEAERVLADLLIGARRGMDNMVSSVETSSTVQDAGSKCRQIRSETLTELDGVLRRTAKDAGVYGEDEGFGDDDD